MSSSSNGSPDVVVYGRQGCVQCTATGRKMQAMGVAYLRPPVVGASSRSPSPSRVRSVGVEVG